MNDPFLLLRASIAFANLGMRVWTALFGARRARLLVFGGMAASTLAAIVLEVTR